jgi:FkbM family methyltransferase
MIDLSKKIFKKLKNKIYYHKNKQNSHKHDIVSSFNYLGEEFYISVDDCSDFHSKHSTPKLERLVQVIPSNPRVVLDVGAHSGIFSKLCNIKHPNSEIYAFEPNIDLLPALLKNSNSKINIISKAVGAKTSTNNIYINKKSSQTSSCLFSCVDVFSGGINPETRKIEMVDLDSFCIEKKIEGRVDVLKIDVQGYEEMVIRGASSIIGCLQCLLLEASFLDQTSVELVFSLKSKFRHAYAINDVYLGADIVLLNDELQDKRSFISQVW